MPDLTSNNVSAIDWCDGRGMIMDNSVEIGPARLQSHPDALGTVEQTEKICTYVPMGIVLLLVGLPVLSSLVQFHFGMAILGGLIMFVIAGIVIKVVETLFLSPMRNLRYRAVAQRLLVAVRSVPQTVSQSLSWHSGAPGALAVTQRGDLVIVDRSTNYEELWLRPSQIVNVSVEREATHITNTKHSGRFTLGGASSGGLLGGYTFGGRSRSTTRTVETAFLEIRYQLERNGIAYTTVVPFGNDRRGADALSATLNHLEHAGEAA